MRQEVCYIIAFFISQKLGYDNFYLKNSVNLCYVPTCNSNATCIWETLIKISLEIKVTKKLSPETSLDMHRNI